MTLFCFDVDGTLDCSNGPITVAMLDLLAQSTSPYTVVIVSPSGAYTGGLPRIANNATRKENLIAAREAFTAQHGHSPLVCLYVSDNKDYTEAEAAGFAYIEASEFAKIARVGRV